MAAASVMISDPATCSGPAGPFAHVYVTITDVQANVSPSAGDGDSGRTDLTPGLSSQPKQVDLLGQANNQCFLATLGDTQQLQAGAYQQIRLILADNSATVSNNACGGSTNCVVLSADSSVHTLLLSSESKTGLKIPSGQIASGGFTIAAGQTKDLDIELNTCASIVQEGNGQYRLKPVLHAGEVSATSTSINGKVLDSATGNPVNGQVLVALEQKDATGVDRIMMATLAGSDGLFVFCPIPTGTYDIVVVGEGSGGTGYQPSIVTGTANGQTIGTVNLYPPTGGSNGVVQFTGLVSSQNSTNQATSVDAQGDADKSADANSEAPAAAPAPAKSAAAAPSSRPSAHESDAAPAAKSKARREPEAFGENEPVTQPPVNDNTPSYLWVGRFEREERAQSVAKKIQDLGLSVTVVPRHGLTGQFYIVVTGPYGPERVESAMDYLKTQGFSDVRLIKNPLGTQRNPSN